MNAAFRTRSVVAPHFSNMPAEQQFQPHALARHLRPFACCPISRAETDEEIVMSKFLAAAAASLSIIGLSGGAALAADYDGEYRPERHRTHHNYSYDTGRDSAEVREEQRELAQARRRLRWAWWHGDDREARRAAAKIEEERRELWQARRKVQAEQSYSGNGDYYDAHPRYHRWD
jgi:hypothetical protein